MTKEFAIQNGVRTRTYLHSSHMRFHLEQHVEGRGDAPPHPTSIPNVSSTCAIRNKLFNFVGACLAAARRCHLDKAQFVRCGDGGIGSHFDEDISRASESRALLFSSMTTHLTSEWMDGIDRPCDSRIYGPDPFYRNSTLHIVCLEPRARAGLLLKCSEGPNNGCNPYLSPSIRRH